jgi:hypothetical protein
MSSANACGSSKRVPGSRPATLRNSLSPWTRPLSTLPKLPGPLALPPISTLAAPVPSFQLLPRDIGTSETHGFRPAQCGPNEQKLPARVGSDFWSEIPRPIERNAVAGSVCRTARPGASFRRRPLWPPLLL